MGRWEQDLVTMDITEDSYWRTNEDLCEGLMTTNLRLTLVDNTNRLPIGESGREHGLPAWRDISRLLSLFLFIGGSLENMEV